MEQNVKRLRRIGLGQQLLGLAIGVACFAAQFVAEARPPDPLDRISGTEHWQKVRASADVGAEYDEWLEARKRWRGARELLARELQRNREVAELLRRRKAAQQKSGVMGRASPLGRQPLPGRSGRWRGRSVREGAIDAEDSRIRDREAGER